MSGWSDVYKPALNVEEAALLPARSRSLAGRSALQDALRRADEMGQMQVSNAVEGAMEGTDAPAVSGNGENPTYAFPGSRAALHQVRPNW